MNRTSFPIDGFNIYHSMHDPYQDKQIKVKWLDLNKLCQSLLYNISKDAELQEVYYFSAIAKHLQLDDPEKTIRHKII